LRARQLSFFGEVLSIENFLDSRATLLQIYTECNILEIALSVNLALTETKYNR